MMANKMVFVGPPGAGKTTLRKVFFEFESAERLLKFALDPTYGIESIVLSFGEEIGVFDLAGQENNRWLDSDEKEVFEGTGYIIIVVDCTSSAEEIAGFTKKVISVRDEICPDASTILLVHKIDLLDDSQLIEKKKELQALLEGPTRFRTCYTSIKQRYFLQTFEVFRSVLNESLRREISLESLDYDHIRRVIAVLQQFKGKKRVNVDLIKRSVTFNGSTVDNILEMLAESNFVSLSRDKQVAELIIERGDELIEGIEEFSREKLVDLERAYFKPRRVPAGTAPPFLGIIMADGIGRTLVTAESENGNFNKYMGVVSENELDLIAPFISALEHFSREMRLVNMMDFKVKGDNVTMMVVGIDDVQFTIFLAPETNVDDIKDDIKGFLREFIKKHEKTIREAIELNVMDGMEILKEELEAWLKELNATYDAKVRGNEIFDWKQARTLYADIDDLSRRILKEHEKILETMEQLKVNLLRAMTLNDIEEIRRISESYTRIGASIDPTHFPGGKKASTLDFLRG